MPNEQKSEKIISTPPHESKTGVDEWATVGRIPGGGGGVWEKTEDKVIEMIRDSHLVAMSLPEQ